MATIFTFNVVNTQTIAGVFQTTSGNTITVDWGDGGATSDFSGTTDQAYSKDYGSAGNRTVMITASDESVLTKFTMTQSGANVAFSLSDLPPGLTHFICSGSNTISGSLSDLPSGVTYFSCSGSNTISGSLSDLPSGFTHFICSGSNTISGSLSDLPSGVTIFSCSGWNTISGSLSDLPPRLTIFACYGWNTITKGAARSWATSLSRVSLDSPKGNNLSDKDVDDLLNELNGKTWTGEKRVNITGAAIGKRSAFSDTANTDLVGKLTAYSLNGAISAIATGTLTSGKLYRIVTTEVNHFGTSLVVGDYFISAGTEECDASNTVLEVKTPQTTGATIVSTKGGTIYNFAYKNASFTYNAASYNVVVRRLR